LQLSPSANRLVQMGNYYRNCYHCNHIILTVDVIKMHKNIFDLVKALAKICNENYYIYIIKIPTFHFHNMQWLNASSHFLPAVQLHIVYNVNLTFRKFR